MSWELLFRSSVAGRRTPEGRVGEETVQPQPQSAAPWSYATQLPKPALLSRGEMLPGNHREERTSRFLEKTEG